MAVLSACMSVPCALCVAEVRDEQGGLAQLRGRPPLAGVGQEAKASPYPGLGPGVCSLDQPPLCPSLSSFPVAGFLPHAVQHPLPWAPIWMKTLGIAIHGKNNNSELKLECDQTIAPAHRIPACQRNSMLNMFFFPQATVALILGRVRRVELMFV